MGHSASLPQSGPPELCKGSLNKSGSHKNMKHCTRNAAPWCLWSYKGDLPACWSRAGRGAQSLGWKPGDTWPEQGCPCPQPAPPGNSINKVPGGVQQSDPSCTAAPQLHRCTPAALLPPQLQACSVGREGRQTRLTAQRFQGRHSAIQSPSQALWAGQRSGWTWVMKEKRQMENCSR